MTCSKLLVGLTGGIASGKSAVAKTFKSYGIPNVDADIVARQVVQIGSVGLEKIISTFGSSIIKEDGSLDRIKLGHIVFENSFKLNLLNNIMIPLIIEESKKQIIELQERNSIVVYNAALICEMGNADKYRPLILVSCPRDMQIARLMKRNSFTLQQAENRVNAQMKTEEKIKLADYVIDTSKEIGHSINQTEIIIKNIKSKL